VFQVQEGLTLTTRFDALEKIWGAARNTTAASYSSVDSGVQSTENENLKFELAYVTFNLPVGQFLVGYQQQSVFGTAFADSGDSSYGPRIRYNFVSGPLTLLALWDKVEGKKAYSSTGPSGYGAGADYMENDQNKYDVAFMYNFKGGSVGLLFISLFDSTTDGGATGYKRTWYVFDPYVKATFGPVYVEAEALYIAGKTREYDNVAGSTDMKKSTFTVYAMAMGTFGPAYAGLAGVWVPGDKYDTTDKDESGYPGGTDFNPCLMLFNYDLGRWNGSFGKFTTGAGGQITNAQILQVFGGIKPIPKLDIKLSYTYAKADTDPAANWVDKYYGSEVDLTATYKIYDNLSYMVGAGYLFTGDYWKGTSDRNMVDNDYLLTHKLTLTF